MAEGPGFDVESAHKHFSAACFNRTWDLLDKADRTPGEDQDMIRTAMQMSVGYWQVSCVYATLGLTDPARHYGRLCLEASREEGVGPFFLGYACEALARAASLEGDGEKKDAYLAQAKKAAESVDDADSKKMLMDDLATIG